MKKILIINKEQYGQHIDTYKYCKYLRNKYKLTYLCFDHGFHKIQDGLDVIYIKKNKNPIVSTFHFIKQINNHLKKENYDLIFVVYFSFCSLLKIFNVSNHFLLDIRTSLIYPYFLKRRLANLFLVFETFFFKNLTIISESLRKKLFIIKRKSNILPLGSDILSIKKKNYKTLNLFYVGTLSSRDIHVTVYGLKKFIQAINTPVLNVTYDIFGDGLKKDKQLLHKSISETGLTDIVTYHGRKSHQELQYFFDKCNVGISYIPMTNYFDKQPPTKSFEYIGAGMVCIATSTSENEKIINRTNGILCNDNSTSFKDALVYLFNNKKLYNSEDIIKTLGEHEWRIVINNHLTPVIEKLINKQ